MQKKLATSYIPKCLEYRTEKILVCKYLSSIQDRGAIDKNILLIGRQQSNYSIIKGEMSVRA